MGAALLLFVPLAHAQEAVDEPDAGSRGLAPGLHMSLRLEPGIAVALTDPQDDMTNTGLGQTVKVMFGLNRFLELGPSATFTSLPASPVMTDAGTLWSFGASARLMRPHDAAPGHIGIKAASPWVDADLLYVRTGGLDRAGFAGGGGVAVPLDDNRRFWLGPYVRYSHILQGERTGYDTRDAKILTVGLSLEISTGLEHKRMLQPEPVAVAVAEVPVAMIPVPPPAPDRDNDGVPDDNDNCPDVFGLADNAGCPAYERIIVTPDKLELKQNIAFLWNSSELEDESYKLLDEVVLALKDNRGFKVQVDGHASSEGDEAHNQELSEERAEAVLGYLNSHGISRDRLVSKGFSSSVPAESNSTKAGRASNRRVEFAVSFIILKDGTTP